MPRSYQAFVATKPPFVDVRGGGHDKGLQDAYTGEQRPRVFYTNSSSEYWVAGRAAALTHTSPDSRTDVAPPDHVRGYFFAGAQHGEAAFPPRKPEEGEELANPTPQRTTTRALLRALKQWVVDGVSPPPSRYPRLADGTLVPVEALRFPAIPGVRDPRTGPGPQTREGAKLPFLVPQVDADGNELAGIRVAEAQVPLATVTGWNFANPQVWDADDFYPNLGSYVPFARTSDPRTGDPRRSIAERYPTKDDYVSRVRAAAERLIAERFLLADDLRRVVERAERHWAYAAGR